MKQRYHAPTLLIEQSPISHGLIQSLREQSISVTTYKPDADKRARLIAQTDLIAAGSVRLPQRAEWLEGFVAELLAFPSGRHDDQVDALTQGLTWARRDWGRKLITKNTYRTLLKLFPSAFARLAADPNEAPAAPVVRTQIRIANIAIDGMRQISILTSTPKTARCQRSRLHMESRLLL